MALWARPIKKACRCAAPKGPFGRQKRSSSFLGGDGRRAFRCPCSRARLRSAADANQAEERSERERPVASCDVAQRACFRITEGGGDMN